MARKAGNGLMARLAVALGLSKRTVVPVVRLSGPIGMSVPLMSSMSLTSVSKQLDRAFAYTKAPAVALVVNSPGGAPSQSHLIYSRIRQLAERKKKRVIVFVEDVAASGGYMIACAGDEIVADTFSVVGSIGVVSASFGFDKLIKKIGIERRVHTAGDSKRQLDPFLPEQADDVRRLEALQKQVHEDFIALVKKSRGDRINGTDKKLFNGEYWLGPQAKEFGLVDAIGDLRSVLQQRFGKDVMLPLIAPPSGFLARRIPGLSGAILPDNFAQASIAALEERALWARYGL